MTREEAIAELKYSIEMVHFDPLTGETSEWLNEDNQRYVDACNIAIKALEQEECDKCEVGNPCLYCKHEFEPQEREE